MRTRAGLRLPRTELMIAPLPGATVEVVGRLVGRLSEIVVVTACLGGESWLAVCPASGRIWAIMHPTDMLDVQLAGVSFRVPAGMTALPSAPPELAMVCPPPDAASAQPTVDTHSPASLSAAASTLKPVIQREPWRHERR